MIFDDIIHIPSVHMRTYGLLGLIVLILDVLAIVEIFKSSKDMTTKLLWCLLILFAPVLGLIIYFLFGRGGSPLAKP
jgi:phospholipase D-like protein